MIRFNSILAFALCFPLATACSDDDGGGDGGGAAGESGSGAGSGGAASGGNGGAAGTGNGGSAGAGNGGTAGGGGGEESLEVLCQRGCALEASLDCPNDDAASCLSDCLDDAGTISEPCEVAARIALECAVNRPPTDWSCDEDGEAVLNANACPEESNDLLACIIGNPQEGVCPFEEDDECDDPTGTDLCPAGTDLADCS